MTTWTGKHSFKPDQWGGVVTTEKSANLAKYEEEANLTYLQIVAALARPLCHGHCHKVLFSCSPLKLPFEYAATKDDKFNEVEVRYTQLWWHMTHRRACPCFLLYLRLLTLHLTSVQQSVTNIFECLNIWSCKALRSPHISLLSPVKLCRAL